ncbi:MAG: (Fe-S)-binding protein [Desulfobacterota bacterium]|nr:(Fe-S)-binding protein [Thermodesulfobacteriota bacterium]MDW8002338.1 (Fe-S)-binding protein [Deltaproteobacteria bacterium]
MDALENQRIYACIQCGKCTGGCPESGRTPLNVRMIVRKNQFGIASTGSDLWYCTTCGSCTIRCPRDVKPQEVVLHLRSILVESGEVSPSIQRALENTFLQKNPFGRARSKRGEWVEKSGLEISHGHKIPDSRILFSCCVNAYDPRCMVIPTNVAKLLNSCGIKFGVLKEEEACCGNEIKRLGEMGLFEELRDENVSNFEKYGIKEVIAVSPHCMNTIKNEYNGRGFRVFHYSELLWSAIVQGLLTLKGSYRKRVIYHDPCFLGKQNGIFEEPRNILRSIDGLELLEFTRSRENSLCCEGGGGRMFYEVDITYVRNAKIRVAEAKELGAQIIAVACPFCLMTLEEEAVEQGIEVKEISEIIMEVLE